VRNYPLGGLKAYCFSAGYLIKRHLDDKKVILGGITRNNTETNQKKKQVAHKKIWEMICLEGQNSLLLLMTLTKFITMMKNL